MPEQRPTTIDDAFDLFILDCQAQRFTTHTLRFYRGRLSLFTKWMGGTTPLAKLTSTDIKKYLVSLQERDLSSAYIHSHARAIRTFCNYCVRDELIDVSPFDKVKMPVLAKKVLPALEHHEVAAILAACTTQRDRAVVLLLLDSGIRASEAVALNVEDVDMQTGSVHVHQGKQQKDRITYTSATVRKAIKRYLIERNKPPAHGPLFVSEHKDERMTYFGLAQMLRRLRDRAGVKEFSAHACRRTFALTCLRGGMDIFVLAKLMGHSDITVLRQYLAIANSDLQNAHDKASPIDKLLR